MTVSRRVLSLVALLSATVFLPAAVRQPIRKPTFDPAVPVVELFDGLDRGMIDVTLIAKNPHDANLFVTNKSSQPISVQIPDAVAAVHVLKQLAPLTGNGGPATANGNAFGLGNGNQAGPGQPIGGGAKGNGKNGPLFSIPVDKTVQLPLKTVCLAFGQPDPQPKMQYRLVKLEDVTRDPALQETLRRLAAGKIEEPVAQAVAWHLADELSWKTLAEQRTGQIAGLPGTPLYTSEQLDEARELVELLCRESTQKNGSTARAVSERSGR
jgi:hypothetical protein